MSVDTISQPTIAFIGVGNMAGAIIKGLIQSGYPAERIIGTSRTDTKRTQYNTDFGITMLADNAAAVSLADMVVLCVKPIQMQAVIADFVEHIRPEQLYVSVAAGLELASLQAWLGPIGIVRSMPNTPSQLGAGVTGLIANELATSAQKTWVEAVFASVGTSLWVTDEAHMHTVTALAGSSPAYFFRFLEAMIRNGLAQGLDEESCRTLASHAMLGAARMATELDKSIAQMRIDITSPNGTTEQALLAFESSDIDQMVDKAMTACADRSKTLASQLAATPNNEGNE